MYNVYGKNGAIQTVDTSLKVWLLLILKIY